MYTDDSFSFINSYCHLCITLIVLIGLMEVSNNDVKKYNYSNMIFYKTTKQQLNYKIHAKNSDWPAKFHIIVFKNNWSLGWIGTLVLLSFVCALLLWLQLVVYLLAFVEADMDLPKETLEILVPDVNWSVWDKRLVTQDIAQNVDVLLLHVDASSGKECKCEK